MKPDIVALGGALVTRERAEEIHPIETDRDKAREQIEDIIGTPAIKAAIPPQTAPRMLPKPVVVDVDDTLILWDLSELPEGVKLIEVDFSGYISKLGIHQKNVNLVKKFAKLGYTVIVWSKTGGDWAQAIVKALKLEQYVSYVGDKPLFYIDDMDANK